MPYIHEERKNRIVKREITETGWKKTIDLDEIRDPGELNFAITTLLIAYVQKKGILKYQFVNDVVGAVEGAKHEFYRRIAAPYEDKKIAQNGDVYPETKE